MKDSYYFFHDANARHDPKITRLLLSLKSSGYGIFWVIIEMLRESKNYEMNMTDIESIAYQSHEEKQKVEEVIKEFGLFIIDEKGNFWSESLKERMKSLDERRLKLSMAGKLGAQSKSSHAEATLKPHLSKAEARLKQGLSIRVDKSRVEESRVDKKRVEDIKTKHLDCVFLTDKQFTDLETKYGSLGIKERIERLNNYIMSHGKKYKSHYHTILAWEAKNNKQPSALDKIINNWNSEEGRL